MTAPITTAEYLGRFRKELLAEGFSEDDTRELVFVAAKTTLSEGLGVKSE